MRILPRVQSLLGVTCAFAVAYTAWVFTGRIFERQKLEQRAAKKRVVSTPEFDRIYSGDSLKILQFYARDGEVAAGRKTLLCYSVLNATDVRMEPPVEGTRPALNQCIEISPPKTTTYALFAEGTAGAKASQTVTVRVSRR